MVSRSDWATLNERLISIKFIDGNPKISINITDLCDNVQKFYVKKAEISSQWRRRKPIPFIGGLDYHAKAIIILLKNKFEPEQNPYIKNETESYNWLVDNLGRITGDIKESKPSIRPSLPGIGDMQASPLNNPQKFQMERYIFKLIEIIDHLAFYPLKNTYFKILGNEFRDKENKLLGKDHNLFWYLVFLEYFHSTEALGAITSIKSISNMPRLLGTIHSKPTRRIFKPSLVAYPESGEEALSEEDAEDLYNIEEKLPYPEEESY